MPDPASDAMALRVLPPGAQTLSAAARAYNLQLTRIDKLRSQLADLDALALQHRRALHEAVAPLRAKVAQWRRELALVLDACLQGKLLSQGQAATARDALCRLARDLAEDGDTAMRELHDRHSPRSLAQLRQDHAAAMRQRLEAVLGEPLADEGQDLTAEQLVRAGMERLRRSQQAAQERRREAAQARRSRKRPGSAQREAGEHDADTLLRRLFRQLASALHPDREPDAAERLRKTALMSEANAAYEKRDLVTLLQIQARADPAHPDAVQRMPDERLAALTLLLKSQVADLERERAALQASLAAEFDLPGGLSPNANALQQQRIDQVQALESELSGLSQDLVDVGDERRLKRWLNARRDPHQSPAPDRA